MDDVSGAILQLEPVCAGMCAAREDRSSTIVPALERVVADQHATIDDRTAYNRHAREFHEAIVQHSGNESIKVLIGALHRIWSAHGALVWGEQPPAADTPATVSIAARRRALRDHEKLAAAIAAGNEDRSRALVARHVRQSSTPTLELSTHETVSANLVFGMALPVNARTDSAGSAFRRQ